MRIQHNIPSMNAYRNFTNNNSKLNGNLQKLSSGYAINKSGDDAAGLAISEKMRAQITGLQVAQKNAKDGISVVQTAEGALTEVHDMLNRMYSLSEQAANGIYSETERGKIQDEIDQLSSEINRIADSTNFNGQKLLDGSLAGASDVSYTAKTDSKGAISTLSFEGKTGAAVTGGTISVDGKTFEFVDAKINSAAQTGTQISGSSNYAIKVNKDSTAAQVAAEVKTAISTAGLSNVQSVATAAGPSGQSTKVTIEMSGDNAALKVRTGMALQIGDDNEKHNMLNVSIDSMKMDSLFGEASVSTGRWLDVSDQDAANVSMGKIKDAIDKVSSTRGNLGAMQNRLDHTINNLSTMRENIQDAESAIRDTDIAEEMMSYTKNNIMNQAAQAMLAQANQLPQGVLQLLG